MCKHKTVDIKHDQYVEYSSEYIEIEVAMIPCSNTVIDPGTVVVKSLYATVADVAVTRTLSTDHFTLRT